MPSVVPGITLTPPVFTQVNSCESTPSSYSKSALTSDSSKNSESKPNTISPFLLPTPVVIQYCNNGRKMSDIKIL